MTERAQVNSTGAVFDAMARRWALPKTLMGGTLAMRDAGTRYMPRFEAETDLAYSARLAQTTLFNAFRRTVVNFRDMVFSKPVLLQDDVPANMVEWAEDIDLTGRHLNEFARSVFEDGLVSGISYILVDMPPAEQVRTRAEEEALGIRPYFVHIRAEDLIGFRYEPRGGRPFLTQVRIREYVTRADGDFGEVVVERIRVLEPGLHRVFEQEDGHWRMVEERPVTAPFIPLVPFYAARVGFMEAVPPLEDLAWLNLTHWQSSGEQRHILRFARMPLLFGKGFNERASIVVGPDRLIRGPENSDLKYVEHSGAAIEAGRQDLKDLEERMQILGLEFLIPQRGGNQTATAKAIDSAKEYSSLQAMALSLGDTLEQAMWMAQWWATGSTEDNGGSVKVNTDFGISTRDATDIQALITLRMAGQLSRETFYAELKRRGVLMDDFDAGEEIERLESESPGLGTVGAPDDGNPGGDDADG